MIHGRSGESKGRSSAWTWKMVVVGGTRRAARRIVSMVLIIVELCR